MAKDYDIVGAFQEIEETLINSMMRNVKRHRQWELEEGFDWSMWQAEQLKSLQEFRVTNNKQFKGYFSTIEDELELMLKKAYADGNMDQEVKILNAIKKGYKTSKRSNIKSLNTEATFFKINDRKLNSLIKATKTDLKKAQMAMLRMSNDQYRKIIFNAQVYANTGAGTVEKAIDMATRDFLSKGINCVEYKNGARVNICDYASMAIRTANKRAYLQGEGAKRKEWGVTTVIVTKRGAGCPKCVPFQGKVYIDDVWSGGKVEDGPYPLISEAIAKGLYHPNCKDTHTTYFDSVSSKPSPPSKEERRRAIEEYNIQQRENYIQRTIRKYEDLERYSLDSENREKYKAKRKEWKNFYSEARADKYISNIVDENSNIDVIRPRNIYKELNKSKVGKEVIEYIEDNTLNIEFLYESIPEGIRGICWGEKQVEVYIPNTKTKLVTAQTLIHEVTHLKYKIEGTQWSEVVCFLKEKEHIKGKLTIKDKRDTIKIVKKLYPNLPWR